MNKDRNKPNKIYLAFLIISWILAAFFFIVFLMNSGLPPKTPTTIYYLSYLIASSIFFVLPFIYHLKVGPIEARMKPEPEEGVLEEEPKTVSKAKERSKTAMELKILNTLWRRQMLRFPDLNKTWAFKLNEGAPEFLEFRDASNRLIGESLISETESNHFLRITTDGLRYCAKYYEKFPPDMWFEDVQIPESNRKRFFEKLKQDGIME